MTKTTSHKNTKKPPQKYQTKYNNPEILKKVQKLYFSMWQSERKIAEALNIDRSVVRKSIALLKDKYDRTELSDTELLSHRIVESNSEIIADAWVAANNAESFKDRTNALRVIQESQRDMVTTLQRMGIVREAPTKVEHEVSGMVQLAATRLEEYMKKEKKRK